MTARRFHVWADYVDSDGTTRRALVAVRDRVSWTWRHANRIARDFAFQHGAIVAVRES